MTAAAAQPTDEGPPQGTPPQGGSTSENPAAIDPNFLEALPDSLRAEVLSGQPTQQQAGAAASGAAASGAAAGGAAGSGAAAGGAAQTEEEEDSIDPEFLAALPPDIQAEVLEQQRMQRRRRQMAAQAAAAPPAAAAVVCIELGGWGE